MNRVRLEEGQSFKHLDMTTSKDNSCVVDVCLRIMAATAMMARLNWIGDSRSVSF